MFLQLDMRDTVEPKRYISIPRLCNVLINVDRWCKADLRLQVGDPLDNERLCTVVIVHPPLSPPFYVRELCVCPRRACAVEPEEPEEKDERVDSI